MEDREMEKLVKTTDRIALVIFIVALLLLLTGCTTLERKTHSTVCIGWCWHIEGESNGTSDLPTPRLQMTRELGQK